MPTPEQVCRYCHKRIEEGDTRKRWVHTSPPPKDGADPAKPSARCADGRHWATPVLRPGELRDLRDLLAQRDRALDVLASLDASTMLDLVRRARFSVRDGFPASSTGASDVHGGRGSNPTEDRVLSEAGGADDDPDTWPRPPDPVQEAIARVFALVGGMDAMAAELDRRRRYVYAVKDSAKEDNRGLPRCANAHCPDLAAEGYAGRCRPCWEYRREHDADAPEDVIERRQARRIRKGAA